MIDHMSLNVSDLEKSRDFFLSALTPLGYVLIHDIADVEAWDLGYTGCAIGTDGHVVLWLAVDDPPVKTHIAFTAKSEAEVEDFYDAALAAGATDNGEPGLRAEYAPNYFGAFVRDLDGNNIEAVYRR